MSRRLLVDADALGRLVAAATRPDPAELRAALAGLVAAGIGTPSRPWVSIDEAARTLGVSERTIRRQANSGQLPSKRIGRRLLIANPATSGLARTGADTPHDNVPASTDSENTATEAA